MKSRLWILFLLILISCQNSSHQGPRQSLRINIRDEPQSLDPRKARDLNAITLMHILFEGLTRIGKDGSVELALADKVEVSDDGLRYQFHLREANWTIGEPITSYDFAESWRRVLDPSFPTDLAYQLFVIKGAKLAKLGETSVHQIGIDTPDPQTLVVQLEQPIPYFLELLTFPSFFPVFHQIDEQNPNWAEDASSYVSNGPFVLRKWKHSDVIEVVRNPSYWDAENVQLKQIDLMMLNPETEFRMYSDGALDWAGAPLSSLPPDALAKLKQNQTLKSRPLMGTYFLRVNTTDHSFLSQPLFRRALALALDRQKITDHILQGGEIPAKSLVPPAMGLTTGGYFSDANPSEARNLLISCFEQSGQAPRPMPPITLLYVSGERSHLIAQAIQQQIETALNIPIQLEAVELKMFYERVSKRQYQLAQGSWIADFNDPINFLEVFKFKDGGTNNTGWEHPKYIERLNLSAVCRDPEERRVILRESERLLIEQMPLIPLFHFSLNYLQGDGIKDVCISPIGQIDFRWSYTTGD